MLNELINNKMFKNYISFIIPLFILEIMFRILSDMPVFDWAVLRIFISSAIISLFVSIISLFFKEKISRIISSFILLFITIYTILQAGFKNFIGVYISTQASSQLGAVSDYVKDFISSFDMAFWLMLIPFLIYCGYKFFLEEKIFPNSFKEEKSIFMKKINRKSMVFGLSIIILLSLFYYQTLSFSFMQNDLQLEKTKDLFRKPENSNISVNQFGPILFGMLDLKMAILNNNDDVNITEVIENNNDEVVVTDYSRVFDDTKWIELQSKETNNNYKTLNNYFMNRSITPKNEYTGLFEGKNLIMIMMESVNEIFINPEYYPTFYKMYTEGLSFTNNYSPRNSCATGNNEMSGMISLYSIYRTCTSNTYKDNTYNESIFGLFNKAGYVTNSFHNYPEDYYFRKTIHKNMGSGAYYGVDDLGISYTWEYKEWPSDILLMEKSFEHIDTTKPFMTWLTTVTSHQPYYVSSEFGDKHLDLFSNTNYSLGLKRYMSKLKELDLALDRLLKILEERNVLDDTVIVLFGDHYPYGLHDEDVTSVLPYATQKNNIEKTPLVIYNSKLEGKSKEEYTSYINLVPTIANLFNLDYDPRLYMGEDILATNYKDSYKNRVIFADGSWENDKALYNATNGTITYFGSDVYTNEEIIKYNKEINNMIKMSNLAITTNYFAYLDKNLKENENGIE